MNSELRWWWVRHAPSAGAPGVIHGGDDVDADLSDQDALLKVAESLPRTDHWYVSGLVRARQTASAICNGADLNVVPEFNEQSFGDWEGLAWDELPNDDSLNFWQDVVNNAAPNGESYIDLFDRVCSKIERITKEITHGDIIVVAHDGPIRAAIDIALGGDMGGSMAFELDNLSCTRLVFSATDNGTNWRIGGVNG